eukprot:448884-Rhodomonas_salina.2
MDVSRDIWTANTCSGDVDATTLSACRVGVPAGTVTKGARLPSATSFARSLISAKWWRTRIGELSADTKTACTDTQVRKIKLQPSVRQGHALPREPDGMPMMQKKKEG